MCAFLGVQIALLLFYSLFTDDPFIVAEDEDEDVSDEEEEEEAGQDEEDYAEEQAADDSDDENSALMGKGQKSSCTQYASLPTVHTLPYILWVTQIKQNNNGFYLL